MPKDISSLPPKEDFIAWLAEHAEEEVGLADHLMIAGPVACWLRSLGFSEVVVTREIIMGINQTGFVDLGAPTPEWQRVLAAEEALSKTAGSGTAGGRETAGSGVITGRGMLDKLDEIWYN